MFAPQLEALAAQLGVKSVLVMRCEPDAMVVAATAGEATQHYAVGAAGKKAGEDCGRIPLYCERVVYTDEALFIQDSRVDEIFADNEDETEFGLTQLLGCRRARQAASTPIANKSDEVWQGEALDLNKAIIDAITVLTVTGAQYGIVEYGIAIVATPLTEWILIAAREHTASSVTGVTDTNRKLIQEAIKQGIARGEDRDALAGACKICAPLDGQTVAIAKEFSNDLDRPPAHPRCRCGSYLVY